MPQNFYAMLGVPSTAPIQAVHKAYQEKLKELVHRKHSAERSRSASAVLYKEERELREAMEVLVDPVRRLLYNSFRTASESKIPAQEDELWSVVNRSLIDPSCLHSVRLLASLTTLPLQDISLFQSSSTSTVKPEDEKTEPMGARPSSLKNTSQRSAVRESIQQITRQRKVPENDVTEMMTPPAPQPIETLKDRIPTKPDSQALPEQPVLKKKRNKKAKKPQTSIQELVRRHGLSGALFGAIRENQGWTVLDLSQRTNVPVNYIQAIEQEDFSPFSSPVFVRGVVKNIARALGIQERSIVDGFLSRMGF
jgi:ribosome-binding protein aMBF1 (putative translation factor)